MSVFTVSVYGYSQENKKDTATSNQVQTLKPDSVIASVNNKEITVGDFQALVGKVPPNYKQAILNQKAKVINDMITQELLFQAAERMDLENDPQVKESLKNLVKQILVQRYIQIEVVEKIKITDKDLKEYHKKHKEEFNIPEQVRAAHVLVKDEKDAHAAMKRIKNNEDFAVVAKEMSIDPSRLKGGDLGYFGRGRMIPEFENAAFSLAPGEVSGIVKTQFGFHIIKCVDKKAPQAREFAEVKKEIEQKLMQEKQAAQFKDLIERLKNKAEIKINNNVIQELK